MPNQKKVFVWIKNKQEFELVYKKGRAIISDDENIKAKYHFLKEIKSGNRLIKVGLSVASKKGNSVWRNRFKRILKEIIYKDIELLSVVTETKNANLQVIFSPHLIDQNNSKKLYLKDIESSVLDILNKLIKQNPTN